MKSIIFKLVLCALVFASCGDDKPSKKITPKPEPSDKVLSDIYKKERLEEMKKKSKTGNIPAMRVQALSILNHRLKKDSSSYAIVEADVWEYQFVFDGEMSKPGEYKNVWIDFKPDATYQYGKLDQVQGSGKYNYQFDRGELLMIDDDTSQKPQEWSVKNSGDVMVLVGTSTYKDNSKQMKLERVKAAAIQG